MTAVFPEHPPGDRDEKYFVFILRRLYSTDDVLYMGNPPYPALVWNTRSGLEDYHG
jgi:hypothetical protein